MKKQFLLMFICVLCVALLSAPVLAKEESVTTLNGTIQGYNCVMEKKVCPIGMEVPMAAIEDVFVLLVNATTADYYVIPNVDSKVLARLINEEVKVLGYVDNTKKSIWAEEIYIGKNMVWNEKMQNELRDKMFKKLKPKEK